MKQGDRILIDTNVIIRAHSTGCWPAIAGYFSIETVSKCVEEAATGDRSRQDYFPVDIEALKNVITVHPVTEETRLALILKCPLANSIDPGEQTLLAYAVTQPSNTHLLCSPDKGCMNVAARLELLDRLVSLEDLANKAGIKRLSLPGNFTKKWHEVNCTKIRLDIL